MATIYSSERSVPGLAGKFFNGSFRSTIADGNIGTFPLNSTNNSSNVTLTNGMPSTNHNSGVNLWPYITYGTSIGNSYGFIAIGYFLAPTSGTYTFYTSSDDGSGMWIGESALHGFARSKNNAVLDNNLGGAQPNTKRSGSISLTANKVYAVRIVHEEGGGGDNLTFSWSGPSISETTDLTGYFRTPYLNGSIKGDFFNRDL